MLIVSETNAWNLLMQLSLFLKRGFKTIIKYRGHLWGNERILFPFVFKQSLKKNGFSDVKVSYYRTLPNVKWADFFCLYPPPIPVLFIYTHYNIVAKKIMNIE